MSIQHEEIPNEPVPQACYRKGESYTYSISHDEVVNLLHGLATRADAGETSQRECGDLTVVGIEDGGRFLDFLSAEAKEDSRDNNDLADNEIEAVEQMACMASAWRQSIDPDDGFLRIYVD